MGKKRKRQTSNKADFPWHKVDVGLLAPSKAAATAKSSSKTDEDFENAENHYDQPSSSIYRSAERDLEADPNEGVGIFLGLEVLDGSQYDVVEEGGTKRIVPKSSSIPSNENVKKKTPKAKDKKKEAMAEPVKETTPENSAKSEPQEEKKPSTKNSDDNEEPPAKKRKKKKKKKKQKVASDDKAGSNADKKTNSEDVSKDMESTSTLSKIDESLKKHSKDEDPEAEEDEPPKEEEGEAKDTEPNFEPLQNSWMTATGGVSLHEVLCKSLLEQDFWNPTPIQAASLPAAILGRRNIVGAAPTGSG
jgi:ATP-dependent RNA helicase DDX24/MAK5